MNHKPQTRRAGGQSCVGELLEGAFGLQVAGFGFRFSGFGFRVSSLGLRVSIFGSRVSGFGFRVSDFGCEMRLFLLADVGLKFFGISGVA